jgi:hypothetical protein
LKSISCEKCGSTDFTEQDGYLICDYCRSKNIPEVSTKETIIGIQSDVEMLLQKCREDPNNRRRYASLILDIDPTNQEAYQYLR